MKHVLLSLALTLAAGTGQAACFADYKAKQDDPLRLHYGVAELDNACTKRAAKRALEPRLAAAGWELLSIVSVFDETGLEERQQNAGQHFLRY